ncbi:hypothetical protein L6654_08700 [Bradyrhizobium sp. WYCCWR 13023]|uniref:Uncharacterized protein n=1 Tax=Bradyrhizobium zhengyangense TaxID=2911009 RepID=A0A9X1U8S4_9BRAD|nr:MULTISPECIES: hypothetical protein [Bradyrhizobium]MCG2626699.1 hypothetical protein [Bradyrhizobium zhengyangense]MCG2638213.1 hypothetical protein [Bradyrhizobium zhengyangense]MCG2666612.1 hypothetical protein [Bradyrhizobium zhengyangense]
MNKNRQTAQESAAEQKPELPASNRDEQVIVTGQEDRAIKEALEDDEVREMLKLYNRGKHL